MTNPEDRDLRAEQYRLFRDSHRAAMQLQGDYGKWLIASVLLVHLGAIFIISTSASGYALMQSGVLLWFVAGVCLALLCGFVTWINWALHAHYWSHFSEPAFIFDPARWPGQRPRMIFWINVTYIISVGSGVASWVCIPVGALLIWRGM